MESIKIIYTKYFKVLEWLKKGLTIYKTFIYHKKMIAYCHNKLLSNLKTKNQKW